MSNENKKKKFSPFARLLGVSCSLLLIGSIIYVASAGFSYIAGLIMLSSVAGLAGPPIASGEGFLDILSGISEMIVEGIQTIFELILDAISSIFG